MASQQTVLNGTADHGTSTSSTTTTNQDGHPGIDLGAFHWTSVDDQPEAPAHADAHLLAAAVTVPQADPPLGVLSHFKGTFVGKGFNLIFRPSDGSKHFHNQVEGPPPPQAPNENILELNLTEETLCFAAPLGKVPVGCLLLMLPM